MSPFFSLPLLVLMLTLVRPAQGEPARNFGRLELRSDSVIVPGTPFVLGVYLTDTTTLVGGFDLLLEFDFGALVLDSATLGRHTTGQWEYFTSRSELVNKTDSLSTAGFVRVLAIADNQDAANKHPDPRSLKGPGEFVRLYFYASDRKEYRGTVTEVKFLWNKCSDNSLSDPTGNKLYLADQVISNDGKAVILEHYSGPPTRCFSAGYNAPSRAFAFRNLSLRFHD